MTFHWYYVLGAFVSGAFIGAMVMAIVACGAAADRRMEGMEK